MLPQSKTLSKEDINNILKLPDKPEYALIKAEFKFYHALNQIITSHPEMLLLKQELEILHLRDEPVLILGETGTGKSLIAQCLHGNRKGAFVKVNCSGLPDELLESELFGHTKGAFTGAINDRAGKFLAAQNGTIFLDEIGDMPYNMQAKLLHALEDKCITPLGTNDTIKINCRIISATNQPLEKYEKEGKFRGDLLYRLAKFVVKTIPLRARTLDILELMDTLYDPEHKIPTPIKDKICNLPLMGNVRELEAICFRYLTLKKFDEGSFI
jgi:transcriptional regulator with PAS, ATPase and Fis domain